MVAQGLPLIQCAFFNNPKTQSIDFADPYLSGFEYSCPATQADLKDPPSDEPNSDIYRHPRVQGYSAGSKFVKSYDLYALAIVLLEIAYWQPIDRILGGERPYLRAKDHRTVRGQLLGDPQYSDHVEQHLGVTVKGAIWACLKGFGMKPDCDERDAETAANMLREFGERVVMKLSEIKGL